MVTQQATSDRIGLTATWAKLRLPLRCAAVAGLVFCVLVAWLFYGFGSIRQIVGYYFKGETLIVDSTAKSIGLAEPDAEILVPFRLTNSGDSRVRILGCYASCSCTIPRNLPFTLAPDETREFSVAVRTPSAESVLVRKTGRIELALTLYTSNPSQARIPLAIRGAVRGGPSLPRPSP
jgi:Protein of unknown function (DUF1573)